MKRFRIFLILLTVISVSISCSKDSDGNSVVGMGAKIDGESWNAPIPITVLYNNTFTITGTSLLGKIIVITIDGKSVGTYTLSVLPPSAKCACTYKSSITASQQDWFLSASGTVTLTKVDETAKKISGTFEFTLTNTSLGTKSITNGEFNDISYTGD